MAAGLGFKDFATGEVLTAADVDGYLMQGVWVFASATARDAAVTSPQEGNFAFLKDTNVTTYYTGSAWANLDTTGMTNPMTTTGDTIYSSSGSTPARLGIGTAGQVLQVNSGATAPEWATPAAGGAGLTLVSTTTIGSGVSSVTVSSAFSATYDNYKIIVSGGVGSASATLQMQLGSTTSDYYWWGISGNSGSTTVSGDVGSNVASFTSVGAASVNSLSAEIDLECPNLAKPTTCYSQGIRTVTPGTVKRQFGFQDSTTQFTAFTILIDGGHTMTGGTIKVYGYQNS
jgi:hypothetical protein